MTGRIRTVKPEWLDDELLAASSDEARLLSAALILMADDYGRGRGSRTALASAAWGYAMEADDGENAPEVLAKASRAIRELVAIRFVRTYEVAGQRYFEIRNWTKHQKVDHRGAPRVPAPTDETETSTDPQSEAAPAAGQAVPRETLARVSRETRANLAPDPDLRSPIPISDRRSPSPFATAARGASEGGRDSPAPSHASLAETAWHAALAERGASFMPHPSTDGPVLRNVAALVAKRLKGGESLESALLDSARAHLAQRRSGKSKPAWWLEWLQVEASASARSRKHDPDKYRPAREWVAPDAEAAPIADLAASALAALKGTGS